MTEPTPEVHADAYPAVEPTGHTHIDAALAQLQELPERPVDEHVAVYDAVHGVLRTVLAEAGREGGTDLP